MTPNRTYGNLIDMNKELELARISQDYYQGAWEFMAIAHQLVRYRTEGRHPSVEKSLEERLEFLKEENEEIVRRVAQIAGN